MKLLSSLQISCLKVPAKLSNGSDDAIYRLPDGFIFGAGSSSYQVEGAWDEDGKGVSQIDHFFHSAGRLNGDIADDSYHKYKEDVRLLKELKVNAYRFSLSWSRLLPTGELENANKAGVRYYKNLIQELLDNNITPIVTLYHLEHPQISEDRFQGWLGYEIVEYFEKYAMFAFQTFGDQVKWWTTLNEPHIFATLVYGYGDIPRESNDGLESRSSDFDLSGINRFGKRSPGRDEYLTVHHMILAHARAYRLNHKQFAEQGGRVGISLESYFARPKTSRYEDIQAAERRNTFELGWVADPLLRGDYPPLMRRTVDAKCAEEGLQESRLPSFTQAEKMLINGTLDFLGLNAYFGLDATDGTPVSAGNPSYDRDSGVLALHPDDPPTGERPACTYSHATPWSIRESLLWLRDRYGDISIMVTENGIGSYPEDGLDDHHRQVYLSGYLRQMLRAIHEDKCNVIGYIAWSLLDSFEWESYDNRFGLVRVDHDSPNKTRTLKMSGQLVQKIMTERFVPEVLSSGAGDRVASSAIVSVFLAVLIQLYQMEL
ncbi:myrosinase 1-like [Thrips palmi]|uniref:Myrosinase 1-like n=1 Tax=Thrips palmi TaxID=161013 RepID=A0A6P8YRD2_THRPL|nr:myrosinase 1-like [Thrips palmi]